MKLVLAIYFFALYFSQRKVSRVRAFLFFMLSASCFLNLLIADDVTFESLSSLFALFCVGIFFTVLIFCLFPNLRVRDDFANITLGKLSVSKLVLLGCIPVVIINLYIIYNSYLFIMAGDMSMTSFKNEGHATTLVSSMFPSFVTPFIRLFSLLGWFCMVLLVINIIKRKYYLSLLSFIGTLNIPLLGLIGFSRSGIIYYVFSIFILWLTFEKDMEPVFARMMKRIFMVLFGFILAMFYYITYQRFSNYDYWWIYEQSGSNVDIVLFSVIYYFTSWIDNTIYLLNEVAPPLLGQFTGYFSLPYHIVNIVGVETASKGDVWASYFNEYSTLFVGLFLDTLFDMGVFGMLFFLVGLVIFRVVQKSTRIDFSTQVLQTIFVSQYFALFFAGNIFSYFFFSAALVICFVLLKLCKTKYFKI
ncbi:O-antigen polymerase [Pseudoalteromonas sp. OOF1S-7]|uniref:O-antigen polymerase n=1 Tax=Pseudoalteromonas sp. OOF1S-7 TaxID=2917757 RepID=UPI001EF734AA|nr:O-antigen polymerase [Pseudoalteromonas sp. OOF1S-7]MCG7536344.1 oligosaccharide repeat unit polymerase [Pseudoalteromonas sp. OOF1S-7]